ncbi:MAG: asparagine synthase-related protein [Bacillota bacterium]|nr:asparagine synthase-related protein [Bacillota bacterium]
MQTRAGFYSGKPLQLENEKIRVKQMMHAMQDRFSFYEVRVNTKNFYLCESPKQDDLADIHCTWDESGTVIFRRDTVGHGSLYWIVRNGIIYFASEIKALLGLPFVDIVPDLQGIAECFVYWKPLENRTVFSGVFRLEAGESLVLKKDSFEIVLSPLPCPEGEMITDEDDAAVILRNIMNGNLENMLQQTKKRTALFYSGGLDSTVILAELVSLQADVSLFSISFTDRALSEKAFQKHAAAYFPSMAQHRVEVGTEQLQANLEETLCHIETPLLKLNPVALNILTDTANNTGFECVLSGEGADEWFYGYDFFAEALLRAKTATAKTRNESNILFQNEAKKNPSDAYYRSYLLKYADNLQDPLYALRPRIESAKKILPYFRNCEKISWEISESGFAKKKHLLHGSILERSRELAQCLLLPEYLVTQQAGQILVNHGMCGYSPFLEKNIANFAKRLPDQFKLCHGNEKHILKKAYENAIPLAIQKRKKFPLTSPTVASFIENNAHIFARDLSDEAINKVGIFQPKLVQELLYRLKKRTRKKAGYDYDANLLTFIFTTQVLFRLGEDYWGESDSHRKQIV